MSLGRGVQPPPDRRHRVRHRRDEEGDDEDPEELATLADVDVLVAQVHLEVAVTLFYRALNDLEVLLGAPADPRRQSRSTDEELRWRETSREHEVGDGQVVLYLVAGDVAPLTFEVPDNGDEEFGEAIFSAGVLPEPMLHGHDGRDGDLVHCPLKIFGGGRRHRGEPRGDGVLKRNLVSQEGVDEVTLPGEDDRSEPVAVLDVG